MDLGNSFSKLKKKVKHRLAGKKHKPGGNEAGADGEIVRPEGSLPRPEPHVVAGDGEGNGANAGGRRARLTDPPPQQDAPVSVPTGGSENDQEEGGVGVDRKEVIRSHSHLNSDIGVEMGGGLGREDDADEGERSGKTDGV